MKQYTVTGMSCAACSSRVEKAVTKVPGVTSCSVSLLTNSMGVEGSASDAEIIQAVENAGYGAAVKTSASQNKNTMGNPEDELLKDKETPVLKRRLLTSLGFLVVLMYFSMGHMMWDWPVPKIIEELNLKGKKKGKSQISTIHSNFIEVGKNENYRNITSLIEETNQLLYNKLGYYIDLEIECIKR